MSNDNFSNINFKELIESLPDAIIIVNRDGLIVLVNSRAEFMFGYLRQELLNHPFENLMPERFRDHDLLHQLDDYVDPHVKPMGKGIEIYGLKKDGQEFPVEINLSRLEDGKETLVISSIRNMMKLESIGLLTGGIAHDFNNLLTSILGNIHLIKAKMDPYYEWVRWLDQIEKAALRAKEIASQLRTFAKEAVPVKRVVSIRDVVEEAVGFAMQGSNWRFELIFSDPLWEVELDSGQIIQVIHNLMINACQAMPKGGVIHVMTENMTLKEKETDDFSLKPGDYLKISVKDSGIGIPKEHLHKLFDPYFTTKEKGTGLGLSNSYAIIKKHHGTIIADSQKGSGSTFTVYLPARRAR